MVILTLKSLGKKYGEKAVLKDLNACFYQGKIYGIVGQNGAGKTTLFRCIAGLETFDGTVVSPLNPLKNALGYLLSESYFLPYTTGEEYIYLLTEGRHKQIENLDDKNIFDLPLKQYISSYSTGMKKKLAIMAILLQKNDLYIMDEPYNGLDLQSSMLLTEIILKLKAMGKTIILSSHIFSSMTDTCDEILVIKDGAITQCVNQADFSALEDRLKEELISKQIDKIFE